MPTFFEQMRKALGSSLAQEGGKKRRNKCQEKKAPKKLVRKMRLTRMRGGEMVITDDATGTTYKCHKEETAGGVSQEMNDEQITNDITENLLDELKSSEGVPADSQTGGGKKGKGVIKIKAHMNKEEFKNYLARKNGDFLKKLAKSHNIKITTKKNGVTKEIKIDTLRQKLLKNARFLKK